MALIKYIDSNGNETEIDVPTGKSVMQGAFDNGVDGILAECGGNCSCATCHVYVDPEWFDKLQPADDMEQDMIGVVAAESKDNSRLSCQIKVSPDMEGLVVHMPETQI
jgi:2Fe-2S ferredoxin